MASAVQIGLEQTRKRAIDPRRRQAALSFLSNISLDGRPVQDDGDDRTERDSSALEGRTGQSLVCAVAQQTLGRAAGFCAPDADACSAQVLQSVFSSPFSAVPPATRGRLQTFTQGILPVSYSRQSSQNYCCLEGGQIANSALELQRSR